MKPIFSCESVKKEDGFYNFKNCIDRNNNKLDVLVTVLNEFKAKGKLKKAIDEALK